MRKSGQRTSKQNKKWKKKKNTKERKKERKKEREKNPHHHEIKKRIFPFFVLFAPTEREERAQKPNKVAHRRVQMSMMRAKSR